MAFDLRSLEYPIVQAPMAGGPSTPALAAAVGEAGGLGFLAAGYKTPEAVADDIAQLRIASDAPFGVNLFIPPTEKAVPQVVAAYAQTLTADAERHGVTLGDPRFDDDAYAAKLELVIRERVPLASFTFGSPAPETVTALHEHGIAVWVTVTSPEEAALAHDAGADALVAQGTEAGGHRAYFSDAGEHEEYGLLVLLRVLHTRPSPPLVATGGLMDGAGIAAALVAGASAVQLGSAFLLTPEAGTVVAPSRPGGGSRDHPAHPRLQWAHGTRDRQPVHGRARRRRAERVSPGASPHQPVARRGAGDRRRRRHQPLGGSGTCPRPGSPRRRDRADARGRRRAGAGRRIRRRRVVSARR